MADHPAVSSGSCRLSAFSPVPPIPDRRAPKSRAVCSSIRTSAICRARSSSGTSSTRLTRRSGSHPSGSVRRICLDLRDPLALLCGCRTGLIFSSGGSAQTRSTIRRASSTLLRWPASSTSATRSRPPVVSRSRKSLAFTTKVQRREVGQTSTRTERREGGSSFTGRMCVFEAVPNRFSPQASGSLTEGS